MTRRQTVGAIVLVLGIVSQIGYFPPVNVVGLGLVVIGAYFLWEAK